MSASYHESSRPTLAYTTSFAEAVCPHESLGVAAAPASNDRNVRRSAMVLAQTTSISREHAAACLTVQPTGECASAQATLQALSEPRRGRGVLDSSPRRIGGNTGTQAFDRFA